MMRLLPCEESTLIGQVEAARVVILEVSRRVRLREEALRRVNVIDSKQEYI